MLSYINRPFFSSLREMSEREIAAGHAKKYILSHTNTTASAPKDRYHSATGPPTNPRGGKPQASGPLNKLARGFRLWREHQAWAAKEGNSRLLWAYDRPRHTPPPEWLVDLWTPCKYISHLSERLPSNRRVSAETLARFWQTRRGQPGTAFFFSPRLPLVAAGHTHLIPFLCPLSPQSAIGRP